MRVHRGCGEERRQPGARARTLSEPCGEQSLQREGVTLLHAPRVHCVLVRKQGEGKLSDRASDHTPERRSHLCTEDGAGRAHRGAHLTD